MRQMNSAVGVVLEDSKSHNGDLGNRDWDHEGTFQKNWENELSLKRQIGIMWER